jgi:hypothetical protein
MLMRFTYNNAGLRDDGNASCIAPNVLRLGVAGVFSTKFHAKHTVQI